MTSPGYPIEFQGIGSWANEHAIPLAEARRRFAQYGILCAIATSRRLHDGLVFKGGNALDFIWHPNRSTVDLDFTAGPRIRPEDEPETWIEETLQQALNLTTTATGTHYRVHRIRRQPPGDDKTFVSLEARIGFAHQDQASLRQRMEAGEPSPQVVPVEISLNEVLCDVVEASIDDVHNLRVCTIEDIVAEKLRALLQQKTRNRVRSQDLLDIVVVIREHHVDSARVGRYLLQKAEARQVSVSRSAYRDPEVIVRTAQDFDPLRSTVRHTFVEFQDALEELLAFVDSLDVPE
jgi:predicted nucleotidyltransferase component of viral defense system